YDVRNCVGVRWFDFHGIPFGKMMAGPAMPALVYMLQFKDMAERDANWKDFVNHPEWNTMKVKPAYADAVSNIVRLFLLPTDYSQI
ncbi:MAG: NIPSNAP family protein, partial [Bacteroidota bacterium]